DLPGRRRLGAGGGRRARRRHPVRRLRPRDGGRAHPGHPGRGLLPEPGPTLGPPRRALRPPLVGCLPDRRGAFPGALLAGGVTRTPPTPYPLPHKGGRGPLRGGVLASRSRPICACRRPESSVLLLDRPLPPLWGKG